MPAAAKRASGARAKARGRDFEKLLEVHHQVAVVLRLVAPPVVHNQPEAKMPRGRLFYVATTVADYTGMLVGGLYFAVEAKSTSHGHFHRSDIPAHQQAHLDAVDNGGGLALLAIEFRVEREKVIVGQSRYVVRWRDVPWASLRSAPSVSAAALAARGWVLATPCYLTPFARKAA